MVFRSLLVVSAFAVTCVVARVAVAATPTYWDDRTEFEDSLTQSVTDDYSAYTVFSFYDDEAISAVLGETDYVSTGAMSSHYITTGDAMNPIYCPGGCFGSVEFSFTSTSMGSSDGVQAVGFDIYSIDTFMTPYYAYITFADGTTDDVQLPGPGNFWGVTAPEPIERIHIGLSGGGATMSGWFFIDNLTIGRQLCGNGTIDSGEQCDDGGETADCDSNCTLVSCGDGTRNSTAGEQCDTAGDSASCDFDCTFVECGDLYINPFVELCDDGTGENAMCDDDCTAAVCGDGTLNVTAGEDCDDAGDSPDCDSDCTPAECGDGTLNEIAAEECDDAGESATCDVDCTFVVCGDGVLNGTVGEICDDPKGSADCDVDCTVPECGDGLANPHVGEDCDGDGKGTPGETVVCDVDCTVAECGDGMINRTLGEECDDGNLSDSDGCSSLCFIDPPPGSEETGSDGETTDDPPTTGDASATAPTTSPVTDSGSDGTETDTDDGGAATDGGCGCTSGTSGAFPALALFALAFRRRRRSA